MISSTPPPNPPYNPSNLSRQLIASLGGDLMSWWGGCVPLADAVLDEHGGGLFLCIECAHGAPARLQGLGGGRWSRHVVPVVDGVVHDAWSHLPPMPSADYLLAHFSGEKILAHTIPHEQGVDAIFSAWVNLPAKSE